MRKKLYLFICCLTALNLTAQTLWKAELDSIKKTGYYNIEIDQELIGSSKPDFSDLRIKNEEGLEVPYFVRSATSIKEVNSFEDYDLIQNTAKDSLNTFIIKNDTKENIHRFYIMINKADVKIEASIRGSDDGTQWYIVKQRTGISISNDGSKDEAMIILDFPGGNYKFYEVSLFSNQTAPLNIKGVKKLKNVQIYGSFREIEQARKIEIKNKERKTVITFPEIENEYVIGKIEVFISNKSEYLRTFLLIDTLRNYPSVNAELSSRSDNVFYLYSNQARLNKKSLIEINNDNNPPLVIDSIKVYGQERYLCAYLEEGGRYSMEIDKNVSQYPNYDIEHFRNEINADLPIVRSISLTRYEIPDTGREQLFIEKPIFLWGVIIGVGILLTIISVGMIMKMKKRED